MTDLDNFIGAPVAAPAERSMPLNEFLDTPKETTMVPQEDEKEIPNDIAQEVSGNQELESLKGEVNYLKEQLNEVSNLKAMINDLSEQKTGQKNE